MTARLATPARGRLALVALVVAWLSAPTDAPAWEPETTHPGLTERAALHSELHRHLRDYVGVPRGLYEALIVPPDDAPELFQTFSAMNPTHGYVPDTRGQMRALRWLSVGSVVADIPADHAQQHFYDPLTKVGLVNESRGSWLKRSRQLVESASLGAGLFTNDRMPTTEWLDHIDNPLNLRGFLAQYERALTSPNPAERSRHLAGALIAAGGILHLLQDMGSPSHVRGDAAAHFDPIGNSPRDVGSRFERLAALVYSRLGIPAPTASDALRDARERVEADGILQFFTNDNHTGLADRTSERWFSAYTLPKSTNIYAGMRAEAINATLAASLARPLPAIPSVPAWGIDFDAARRGHARLENTDGVCMANYQLSDHDRLSWHLDDPCVNEQLAAILPEVTAYSSELINWLFRGRFDITPTDPNSPASAQGRFTATIAGTGIGAGTLAVYWDNEYGVRDLMAAPAKLPKGAPVGTVMAHIPSPPENATAVVLVFVGKDRNGHPLISVGHVRL
ncbi:MAG: hypothetical protein Tsb0020_46550 [Haliangiales bacterium]